jgi:aminoglycoside phosphotransferase (APT) family kinase protein
MALKLDDGTTIIDLSRPRQGTRHRVLFGVEAASGREVAVKIESSPGALATERRALEWLGAHGGSSPRLRAAGTLISAEDRGALCLVTDRVGGEAPRSLPGWGRLGRSLADLARLPWRGSGLDVEDHGGFLDVHERRLDDLGRALGADLHVTAPPVPPSYPASPLVLTHGDPGPGNFLDDGAAGTLIDWEDARVCPRGLDLGRAAFIALVGSGPEGYAATDQTARARAVTAGLLAGSGDWAPDADDLTWWLAVAGVQFAHRRLERAGEPGVLPWLDAIAVLDGVTAGDRAGWLPGLR